MTATGLLLSDDLLFSSRITATARAKGLHLQMVRTVPQLLEHFASSSVSGVILDLELIGNELPGLLSAVHSRPGVRAKVIAYGSHVDALGLRQARQAGCDRVLPRSQFVVELESQLGEWLTPTATGEVSLGESMPVAPGHGGNYPE
jgi:hypothetical protein